MSAMNVSQLKERLHDLLMALERFDVGLEDDFRGLEVRWSQLEAAWDGVAYQEFIGSWNSSEAMIRSYISMSGKFEQFLRERIVELEGFEGRF